MNTLKCKICGMNINENNYEYNSAAFIEENKKDSILYCPFCGASKTYIIENNETYNIVSDELDDNTIKILDHAMKLEIFNSDFYSIAAQKAKANEVKKLFEALSRIERLHAKIHRGLGGFKELPKLNEISYDKYDSDNALLELAAKREKHAVEFYSKYKKEVCSKDIIEIFDALTNVEKDHIILTSK